MTNRSWVRRLAGLLIDSAFLFVFVPVVLLVPVVGGMAALLALDNSDCPDPCDGPAYAAMGVWFLLVLVVAVLYWPVLRWRGRRTIGQWLVTRRAQLPE